MISVLNLACEFTGCECEYNYQHNCGPFSATCAQKLAMFLPNSKSIPPFLRPGEYLKHTLYRWTDGRAYSESKQLIDSCKVVKVSKSPFCISFSVVL